MEASRGAEGAIMGDLAVKKSWSDQNLSEFSKGTSQSVRLVRFDELETVRSFLNQELYVAEMAPR
jgi:hypothetical protein